MFSVPNCSTIEIPWIYLPFSTPIPFENSHRGTQLLCVSLKSCCQASYLKLLCVVYICDVTKWTNAWYLCAFCPILCFLFPPNPHGKLESGSPWELQQVPRIIYKISGSRKMALDRVRSTEKAGSSAPPPRSSKVAESMYKYLQTHFEVLKLCIIKSANK